jgi:hypothetical protein
MIKSGVPEEDANLYAEGVRRGGSIVTARVEEDRAVSAQEILHRSRSVDVQDRRLAVGLLPTKAIFESRSNRV